MPTCVAVGCKSRSAARKAGEVAYSMFTFPKKPKLRQKWVKAIKRLNWTPGPTSKLCEKHFKPSDFKPMAPDQRFTRLLPTAVPSIFHERVAEKLKQRDRMKSKGKSKGKKQVDLKITESDMKSCAVDLGYDVVKYPEKAEEYEDYFVKRKKYKPRPKSIKDKLRRKAEITIKKRREGKKPRNIEEENEELVKTLMLGSAEYAHLTMGILDMKEELANYDKELQEGLKALEESKIELMKLQAEERTYEVEISDYSKCLNENQIKILQTSKKPHAAVYSNDTVLRASDVIKNVSMEAFIVMKKHKIPFPSQRTIQRKMKEDKLQAPTPAGRKIFSNRYGVAAKFSDDLLDQIKGGQAGEGGDDGLDLDEALRKAVAYIPDPE